MNVFITGATGFLGSAITRMMVAAGHSVRALRRPTSNLDLLSGIEDQLDWIEGDILDVEALAEGMQGIQAVFHCAAYVGFEGKSAEAKLNLINVQGTANVVNVAMDCNVDRVVHISSIAALGRSESTTDCLDESSEWTESSLNTAYAITKHQAELEVYRGVAEGLDAVIVNPSLIMGPGRKGENTMQIAEQVQDGKLPVLPSGGTNVVDVEDVAAGAVLALEKGRVGERYVLSGHNLSWATILQTLADALGVEPPRRQVSRRVLMIVATALEVIGTITRKNPLLTRETARLSTSVSCYRNNKALEELGCHFRPFNETAQRIASSMDARA
ncbi:MAG: SDR family oxidoreductase [Bacteroidetes Order II. Incertae sedis bacterium]|nr:SDR family oxidoreductase [Bacteroidetes Order II. bacterium]MBT4052524.1 SDR family oxidoreductase [Bacteroidetes Order II. bacterium]MBT4602408.1 SDR family oxidoreductase [Bacteroidetes Order II. bacterium]MBT5249291.1 SDR family oxidoreductase [Bacteroidetes Order II. bacterium]MBT6200774.1 SDR family oxidoreductase [Bacteroidetes Order II. bacterium]